MHHPRMDNERQNLRVPGCPARLQALQTCQAADAIVRRLVQTVDHFPVHCVGVRLLTISALPLLHQDGARICKKGLNYQVW